MTTLTDTQVVTASGGLVELGYSQITSPVVPTTTFGTPNIGLSATVVCDGGPVLVEVFSPAARGPIGTAGSNATIRLLQNGVSVVDQWGLIYSSGTSDPAKPIHLAYRFTPSAGSHTFSVQAATSTSTGYFGAGTGTGASPQSPAFLRVSKIVQATQWPAVTTGTIICTSSTRPAAPFPGQKIYETDTKKELTYDGTSWTQPWNQPWGVIGIGTHDTGATVPANTSFCSVTFTPVLNRYYQAFYTCRTIWGTAGTIGIFDSIANGRIAEQYGAPDPVTLQRTKTFSSTASRTLSIRTDGVQTPISGPYTTNERPAQLVVMDVGPA